MAKDILITLSDTDELALSAYMTDAEALIRNFVNERIRTAKEEIGLAEARRRFAAGETVPGEMTLDELVKAAFISGIAVPLEKPAGE